MAGENTQNVPPGIPTGTPAPTAQAPQPQAPQPTPYDGQQHEPAPRPPQQHTQEPPPEPKNPFSKAAYSEEPEQKDEPAAEPPKENPKQEPEAPTYDQSMDTVVGDLKSDDYAAPAIEYIENVCGDKVDLQRAFGKAVEYGDTNLIDKAYLKEVLGDKADAVSRQAEAVFRYSANKAEGALNEVYTEFGGKEQVQRAGQYFNDSADPETKAAIKAMLDSGKPEQVKYAVKQIKQFAESAGMTYNHQQQPFGQASAQKGISRQEYQDIIYKERNMTPERYEEIQAQRKLGMKQGL